MTPVSALGLGLELEPELGPASAPVSFSSLSSLSSPKTFAIGGTSISPRDVIALLIETRCDCFVKFHS